VEGPPVPTGAWWVRLRRDFRVPDIVLDERAWSAMAGVFAPLFISGAVPSDSHDLAARLVMEGLLKTAEAGALDDQFLLPEAAKHAFGPGPHHSVVSRVLVDTRLPNAQGSAIETMEALSTTVTELIERLAAYLKREQQAIEAAPQRERHP